MKSLILIFMILAAIVPASAQTKQTKARAAIAAVMNEQAAAWNRGDVEGFMKGYWNSPEMIFVSGDNVTKGWQPTLERYRKNYDSPAKMGVLTFSGLEINVISKDAAVVLGNWSLARQSDNPKGKFTLIFRKFKDGWKIVHDHTS